jgi:hypothetical protein
MNSTEPSMLEALEEVAAVATGAGIITLTLFPLALPMLALAAVIAIPFVLVGLAAGLLGLPFVLLRRGARRGTAPSPSGTPQARDQLADAAPTGPVRGRPAPPESERSFGATVDNTPSRHG